MGGGFAETNEISSAILELIFAMKRVFAPGLPRQPYGACVALPPQNMRKLPPLNAIRAFEAVARNGSFTAAAQELHVTTTAISHQIRHLEELIGVKLVDRSTRRMALSPTGERIFPLIQEGFDHLADAFAEIEARNLGSAVVVTTTQAFAERWLLPRMARFRARCPNILVNVEASEAVADLRTGGIDVAIRYGRQPPGSLKQLLLFEDCYLPVVASDAVGRSRRSRPSATAGCWRSAGRMRRSANRLVEMVRGRGHPGEQSFRINWFGEEHLALQALDHGHGPLLASDLMVGPGLESGRYLRLAGPSLPGLAFTVILAPTAGRKPSVRSFVDWLEAEAAATQRAA